MVVYFFCGEKFLTDSCASDVDMPRDCEVSHVGSFSHRKVLRFFWFDISTVYVTHRETFGFKRKRQQVFFLAASCQQLVMSLRVLEKRERILENLRSDYGALGVQNPQLPDPHASKRKFEKHAFEARQQLRTMAMVERVALLQAVHAHLKDMELDMGKSDFETET